MEDKKLDDRRADAPLAAEMAAGLGAAAGIQPSGMRGKIREIPVDQLTAFTEHPFKVCENEDMAALIDSINDVGITVPLIVRRKDEQLYEIVSGHRRHYAAKKLGLETVPCIVRSLNDMEATVLMVDTNLEVRKSFLPSELIHAYNMRYSALRRAVGNGLFSSSEYVPKGSSADILSKDGSQSSSTIKRYIRLSSLDVALLSCLDDKKVSLNDAYQYSFLPVECQKFIADMVSEGKRPPSAAVIADMRRQYGLSLDFSKFMQYLVEHGETAVKKPVVSNKTWQSYISVTSEKDRVGENLEYLSDVIRDIRLDLNSSGNAMTDRQMFDLLNELYKNWKGGKEL